MVTELLENHLNLSLYFTSQPNPIITFNWDKKPGSIIEYEPVSNSLQINCKGLQQREIFARLVASMFIAIFKLIFKNKGQPFNSREGTKIKNYIASYFPIANLSNNLQKHLNSVGTCNSPEEKTVELAAVLIYSEILSSNDMKSEFLNNENLIPENWFKDFLPILNRGIEAAETIKTRDHASWLKTGKMAKKKYFKLPFFKNYCIVLTVLAIILSISIGTFFLFRTTSLNIEYINSGPILTMNTTPMSEMVTTSTNPNNIELSTPESILEKRILIFGKTTASNSNEILPKLGEKNRKRIKNCQDIEILYFALRKSWPGANITKEFTSPLGSMLSDEEQIELIEKCHNFVDFYRWLKAKKRFATNDRTDFKEFFKRNAEIIVDDIQSCSVYSGVRSIFLGYFSEETDQIFPKHSKSDCNDYEKRKFAMN